MYSHCCVVYRTWNEAIHGPCILTAVSFIGLGMRPYMDHDTDERSPKIEFKPSDKSSYKEYVDSIASFLKCKSCDCLPS